MTQVCITVDIEFSIGGAFAAPDRHRPIGTQVVTCTADGREHGLGFILETLRAFGLTATFFVEALNTCYFGDGQMAAIAERILAAGHDVQLHLHPCWLHFRHPDWARRLAIEPPDDSCAGRSDPDLDEMMALGIAAFRRWGVPRPVALRTGNLHVDRAVYRAMARHGFRLSSNVACAIAPPADPQLHFFTGRHCVEGIIELPVLTYTDLAIAGWRHRHNLTITGSSSREIRGLLARAHAQDLGPVVLLTHSHEFVNCRHERFTNLRAHPTNRRRLVDLCRLIADHPRQFSAVTFSGGLPGWTAADPSENRELRTPAWATLGRIVSAQLDDRLRVR